MTPQSLFVATVAVCLFNSLFSPFLPVFYITTPVWLPQLFPGVSEMLIVSEIVFYVSSLMLATTTLLLGGVPAAIYERLATGGRSTLVSNALWLASVLVLTLPAILGLARQ